jgi:hypothetical protein
MNSQYRSKLFNCTFKIYKWCDLKKVKVYKCSQLRRVVVSSVESTGSFYVQEFDNLTMIKGLERNLKNYAHVLLNNDDMLLDELYNFMLNSNKYDVVITRCPHDKIWKRSVILELLSFENIIDFDKPLTYFKVFFVDYGDECLIAYDKHEYNIGELNLESTFFKSLSNKISAREVRNKFCEIKS